MYVFTVTIHGNRCLNNKVNMQQRFSIKATQYAQLLKFFSINQPSKSEIIFERIFIAENISIFINVLSVESWNHLVKPSSVSSVNDALGFSCIITDVAL